MDGAPSNAPLGFPELWESLARARMDIAELKGRMRLSRSDQVARRAKRGALRSKVARGRVRMHFADGAHHTPPCATASGLQKTLHAAMGAAIISLLSAVGTLVFEIVKGMH